MLIVYSAQGSPGASTTAVYLAAQWASTGTELLFIEADPAGGSLSHHLGIQFTPGLASFVASGLEVRGGNLVDHSQDVLFNNLHVMPSTSSPTGARQIVKWLDERAGELRAIAEAEMAVVIDGGRITADSAAAELAAHAAGLVVVARGGSSPTNLEHVGDLLSAEACGEGVERCVVTVGDSPLSAEEWRRRCDITFCGSISELAEATGDLSAFLNRNKRKSKKWRVSLEQAAGKLLPLAKPPASGAGPQHRPAASPAPVEEEAAPPPTEAGPAPGPPGAAEAETAEGLAEHLEPEYAPEPGAGSHDRALAAAAYDEAAPYEVEPYHAEPLPDPYYQPAADYPQAQPAAAPPAAGYQHFPPAQQPVYFEPPPPEHTYDAGPLPVYQAPASPPPPYPPPAAPHQPPHGYQPQAPSHQHPPQQPPGGVAHRPPHYPAEHPPQYAAPPQQPAPPPPPPIAPSGSFRDWAARLYAQAAERTSTTGHGGASR